MRALKKIAFLLYPFGVAAILPLLLSRDTRAGQIRKLAVTENKPGVVLLSFGHTTAISFPEKPEKVVPGAPNRIQVDFLNRDILVTPLARDPGNILVYTKSSRYVILFKVGSEANYDDVVEVNVGAVVYRHVLSIRLKDDSYTVETVSIKLKPNGSQGTSKEVPVSVSSGWTRISGEELFNALQEYRSFRCTDCVIRIEKKSAKISCSKPIAALSCTSEAGPVAIERRGGT